MAALGHCVKERAPILNVSYVLLLSCVTINFLMLKFVCSLLSCLLLPEQQSKYLLLYYALPLDVTFS